MSSIAPLTRTRARTGAPRRAILSAAFAALLLAGAPAPADAQCAVESFQGMVPHGDLIASDGGYLATVADTLDRVDIYQITDDGHTWVNAIPAINAEIVSLDMHDGEVVVGSRALTSFTRTVKAYTLQGGLLLDEAYFIDPVVSIGSNADGSWIVVGLPQYASGGGGGEVRVFRRNGGLFYAPFKTISGFEDSPFDHGLGEAVAMDGSTLAIGAPQFDHDGVENAGELFAYRWNGSDWVLNLHIKPGSANTKERFKALDVDGDVIVEGAAQATFSLGMVAFYEWNGSTYQQVWTWDDSAACGSFIGWSVDIDGDVAVARTFLGAAVFERDAGTWSHVGCLTRPWTLSRYDVAVDASLNDVVGDAVRLYIEGDAGAVDVHTLGTSPVTDLGYALAGYQGKEPSFQSVSPICAFGSEIVLRLDDMRPNTFFWLFAGLDQSLTPYKSGTFVPGDVIFKISAFPTFGGSLEFDGPLPYDLAGVTLYMQTWILDPDAPSGSAATNALRVDFGG